LKPHWLVSRRSRAWTLGLLLSVCALAAAQLRPAQAPDAPPPTLDLEALIPDRFAAWQALPPADRLIVNPVLSAKVEAVYTRTLERVYRNRDGSGVILSIAYGTRQLGDSLQAHRPEYCYRAQGFAIDFSAEARVHTALAEIPVRRVIAQRGRRIEPVTYWLIIGEDVALPGIRRKLHQLRYGLRGEIPDGLLVRVSSLGRDHEAAWALHERFIDELLQALQPAARARLVGTLAVPQAVQRF
jgi:EpsI family protein